MRTTRLALALLLLAAPAAAQDAEKTVLVFGDSLTWGWVPIDPLGPSTRYPEAERWTGALDAALGDGFDVVAEGLNGRTTNVDDPTMPNLNGAAVLPAILASHDPVDLVVIMLGTNDTKAALKRTPLEIALGAGELVAQVADSPNRAWTTYGAPKVLLINPPPLAETIPAPADEQFDATSQAKSRELAPLYAAVATLAGQSHFDAGSVVRTDGVDGIHFSAETNKRLGEAVAAEVKRILK